MRVGPRWSQAIWKLWAAKPSRVARYWRVSFGRGSWLWTWGGNVGDCEVLVGWGLKEPE